MLMAGGGEVGVLVGVLTLVMVSCRRGSEMRGTVPLCVAPRCAERYPCACAPARLPREDHSMGMLSMCVCFPESFLEK